MAAATTWDLATVEDKIDYAQDNHQTLISGYAWNQKTISFSFPLTAFAGTGSYLPSGESLQYTAFTQAEIDITLGIFDVIERFLDIDFVYDATGNGEMKMGHQNMTAGGYAQYPYTGSDHAIVISDDLVIGELGYGIQALIHEIGHSLGLEHPHETGTPLDESLDVDSASIMSYDWLGTNGTQLYTHNSFMLMDILALQSMYGVSRKTSNDLYTADNGISVIADYRGIDTIDISTQSYDSGDVNTIDLKRGYVFYDRQSGNWQSTIYDHETQQWTSWTERNANNGFYNMIITPGSSIEIVVGSAVRDRIIGDGHANTMTGGGGNDRITGGNGADTLWGEAEADVFFYKAVGESPVKNDKFDLIMDFDRGEGDKIDVSGIDANIRKDGNQTFRFDSQGDGSGKTGQISYRIDDGNTHIYGNVDKDKKAEFHVVVNGEIDLRGSDFAL